MIFVALDLETTGLSPETDTIIEIAAIRFEIDQDGDLFVMKNSIEHSQLIHPGRVLTQEVTMITGITSEMLEWKPSFESVRDKVRDFIGDAVIVGHNVLFDIAMFASHGIDLWTNRVIDTFELSEIFSQDVESLNLGFLANRYGLTGPSEDEHRALTDTKVSIRLFLRYLGEVSRIAWERKQIWKTLSSRDKSHTLSTLSQICHEQSEAETDVSELFADLITSVSVPVIPSDYQAKKLSSQKTILIETHGNPSEEIAIIHDAFRIHSHIALVTPGYKASQWISESLTMHQIENMVAITPDKWCSVEYIRELMTSDRVLGRKEMILTLKISYWMSKTTTGLLDEMKYYGEERNMLEIYRCREDEYPVWRRAYEAKIDKIPVLICDAYHFAKQIPGRYPMIRDIGLLEDIMRRSSSVEISFDRLYMTLESLRVREISIHMTDMLSIIRGIYESTPERPTGPLVSPPGDHGETYFVTQAMLWHRGHKWLIHATQTIRARWQEYREMTGDMTLSRQEQIDLSYIERSIALLIRYHTIRDTNTNMILSILESGTRVTYIPRSVIDTLSPILDWATVYGPHIWLRESRDFLVREYGIKSEGFASSQHQITRSMEHIQYHANTIQSGSVILTTSLKHARDLGQELRKIHGKNIDILIQWLSGGKWKMLSIFSKKREHTILIGTIDTWRDEHALWKVARCIIITKLPFDPPTDPYFLARTVGMTENFAQYSSPIVIIRINTLIERIRESGYTGMIYSSDSRLTDTEWGKKIATELL